MFKKTLASLLVTSTLIFSGCSPKKDYGSVQKINTKYNQSTGPYLDKKAEGAGDRLSSDDKERKDNIEKSVQEYFEKRSIDAIRIIGLQGGYIKVPEGSLMPKDSSQDFSYGYYEGKNKLASLEDIEKQISLWVRVSLPHIYDSSEARKLRVNMSRKADITTKINNNYVEVSADFRNVLFTKGDVIFLKGFYEAKIKTRLSDMLDSANELIEKMINRNDPILINDIPNKEFSYMAFSYDDENIIYVITDAKIRIENIPLSFVFANKFGSERKGKVKIPYGKIPDSSPLMNVKGKKIPFKLKPSALIDMLDNEKWERIFKPAEKDPKEGILWEK